MCGICGEIRFDSNKPDVSSVQKTREAMASRGPDSSGFFSQAHVALAHRRLKIIDLSERAQQPMVDSELGLAIVYNGAIYNYPELRAELEGHGYRFFSDGDTEVLLKAFHFWGESFVTRLNGMFAFAIYQRDNGEVLVARDRLGIKPLYYTENRASFRFASSLPALLAGGGVSKELNPIALHHYLTFHSVVPPPHTILADVKKLPPATILRIQPSGDKQMRTYWELQFGAMEEERSLDFEDWEELVLSSLRKAVMRRLVADVPVGVLLSGGLDSSLVVGLLAEAGQKGLNTFSIGFESVNNEKGDEFEYSDIVAERFSTTHHKLQIGSLELVDSLRRCVKAMSEPMVSHDNVGFYLLAEAVSKQVKVVQSGQGADEIFAGYYWYPPLMGSADLLSDYSREFFDRDHQRMGEVLEASFYSEDFSRQFVSQHFLLPGAEEAVDRALRLDTTVMLVDDPVKRVDNMTMAWGLEARVPFLDHELVELAARVPAKFKVADGGKYVLKEAARRVIPNQVIDRPKGYFPVPALKYLRGESLDFVKEILFSEQGRNRGVIRPSYVEKLVQDPENYITPLKGSELWQVALLEFWLQTNGI